MNKLSIGASAFRNATEMTLTIMKSLSVRFLHIT
jgi:hypothetical protein